MTDLATNVLGGILESCSTSPMTGFLRTGCCQVTDEDVGNHGVCAVMTDDFLHYSKRAGNDLSTPRPEYGFPGLRAGDRWCLCSARWHEAFLAGSAPKVVLAATSSAALEFCRLTDLTKFAVDAPPNPHTRKE
ncbi:MAG: DUF2237 domain-containing protein [Rhodocyclaceae bacterium]|jgi:uncharacterized protein (DUF2237 family)|nr:DUF2237 domain-containing protein [Rhodocyclaceae bacterium]